MHISVMTRETPLELSNVAKFCMCKMFILEVSYVYVSLKISDTLDQIANKCVQKIGREIFASSPENLYLIKIILATSDGISPPA